MDRTFVCSKAFSHRSFPRKRESSAGSPPSRGRTEFLLASLLCPHDLDVVARLERCVAPSRTGNDSAVERHRNAPLAGIAVLLRQQGLNGSGSKRRSRGLFVASSRTFLFRSPRRQETLKAEGADHQIGYIIEDEPRHGVRRHRREQNAVAVVAGRIKQTVERPRPRIGASSRLPGRWPTQISSTGNSSTAGTARHAASNNVSIPPAVIVWSKPFSSTVPPMIKRPSRRGTR